MIEAGTHRLGPDNATLSVHTRRGGAAAKAGHDLVIHVNSWQGTLEVGADPGATTVALTADATSLRVHKGTGGIQALGDEEKSSIRQTIDDEILKRADIGFRSIRVQGTVDAGVLGVEGELTLAGRQGPISFDLTIGEDGSIGATAVVTQTRWGLKPYSAMFGALKVLDDVEVVLDGQLPAQSR